MNPEILYSKFLEKSGGDVRTAVLMVWAVAEVCERGYENGFGHLSLWYHGRGRQLLVGLKKAA